MTSYTTSIRPGGWPTATTWSATTRASSICRTGRGSAVTELRGVGRSAVAPDRVDGEALVAFGRTYLGLDYLWGGLSGYGVDCSGFAHLVHRWHGIVIPRDAHDQAAAGTPVPLDELTAGTLVFF